MNLTDIEWELILEALRALREVKVDAHRQIAKVAGHRYFTVEDFGVPKVEALSEKINVYLDALAAKEDAP